jgi:hypothetical protein
MNILSINIGNSRTAAGWFSKGKIRRSMRIDEITPVLLEAVADGETPDGICLGSVSPKQNKAWAGLVKKTFPKVPVLWVDSKLDFGIGVDLKRPDQTGHDRFADAVAGAELCGTPCIVCDFGTATTFNLVLPRRGFSGGVIAPGYGMWFDALGRAAQLPEAEARRHQAQDRPQHGRSHAAERALGLSRHGDGNPVATGQGLRQDGAVYLRNRRLRQADPGGCRSADSGVSGPDAPWTRRIYELNLRNRLVRFR